MTTYNTGNPVPSTAVKDLYDNSQTEDEVVNSDALTTVTRTGKTIKTFAGFAEDFNDFIVSSGFEFLGDYDTDGPLLIERYNQTFTKDGEFWRAAPSLALPYTTVNNWVVDEPKFVMNGDASLRQALGSNDQSLGVALVNGGVRYVTSYASLLTLPKTGTPHVMVFAPGIAGQFTVDLSDTTSPQIYGITMVAADGGRWKRTVTDVVKSSWFGTVGDRVTNDTVALQAAIDYCVSFPRAKPLSIVGSCLISSSLFIDREVETTNGLFMISADGVGGGLYVSSAITLLSSRLPYGSGGTYTEAACTEYTQFEGVAFEASSAALAAYVFDSKYLRLTFSSCYFRKIKSIGAGQYLQSIKFLNCRMREHSGLFFFATDLYECKALNSEFEISGAGFAWGGIARNCHFDYNLYEGSTGPFISGTGTVACSASKNYFEQNSAPDIVLGNAGGGSSGVVLHGNLHFLAPAQEADPSFYPVILGIGTGFDISGNVSSGNLANNNSVLPFGLEAGNNVVGASRVAFSSNPFSVSGQVAHAGGGQALATSVIREVTIFTTTATAGDSAKMPAVSVMEKLSVLTVVNRGAAALAIFPAVGERFAGIAVDTSVSLVSGGSYRFVRESGDAWAIL